MASQPDWRTVAAQAGAIMIAVSGGADSVYLCHHLRAHIPQRSMRFVVVHVNHRTRGAASDADEDFVRQLAQRFDWEFHAPRIDTELWAPDPNEKILREVRIGLLKSLAQALGISVIAFGHHANDLAEGFLLAALRGSGPRGLSAMTEVRKIGEDLTFIRPLLTMTRAEIEEKLRELNETWRDDATNSETRAKRNFLRHHVLPLLSEREPHAVQNIAESARIAAEVDAVYGAAVEAAYGRVTLARTKTELLFSVPTLRDGNAALVPGVIRAFCADVLSGARNRTVPALPRREILRDICARIAISDGDETTFPLIEEVVVWLSNEYGLIFQQMSDGSLKDSFLRVRHALAVLLIDDEVLPLTSEAALIRIEDLERTECRFSDDAQRSAWIDQAKVSGKLVIRRAGLEERVLVGEDASKSVGKYLQENRIPRALRGDVAAVCDDGGILWIPHLARAKRAFVDAATERVVRLSLR
ncbi:MAG: tRNA lysidine(34) synthetase TilS [Candidatus Sumerlaeota bacterium]